MGFIEETLAPIPLPKIVKVEQQFDGAYIEDLNAYIREHMKSVEGFQRIRPGQSIAVTGGSRGINRIDEITRTVCDMVKEKGAFPFIFPAMGSHGGATPEGQLHMLEVLGITEETMGVPILSTMEAVKVAEFDGGRPIYVDRYAHEADGIILINRIKAHTSFKGPYESGLMKMMAIGIGKQMGAQNYHKTGFKDFPRIIKVVGRKVIETENIICGLGIVENSFNKVRKVACLDAWEIPEQEPALLKESYEHLARTFYRKADVMIVQEIGKNISGTGCDSNIHGRFNNEHFHGDTTITRVGILDVSKKSSGNSNGLGLGDLITRRLWEKTDLEQMYPNALTSTAVVTVKIPMILPTDKMVFQAAIKTANLADEREVRLGVIENSKNMKIIYVTENMVEEAKAHNCRILSEPMEIPFDGEGNLCLKYT